MAAVVFDTEAVKIVCISDTHNDDCTAHVPPGDIFLHAGDFTDNGTLEELKNAYSWISKLPHKVKVIVAGNHDLGLDRAHRSFSEEGLALFTSSEARACGMLYLDREMKTVAQLRTMDQELRPVRVYGNPTQPDFLNSSYAFTYKPYPSEGSQKAWATAPQSSESLDIWVTHSPPKDRLDAINIPPLTGCPVLAEAIAKARPLLCVFGHYHYSWGLERVLWHSDRDEVAGAQELSRSEGKTSFDFSGNGSDGSIKQGDQTIFVNAAWMTMQKRAVQKRNSPLVVSLGVSSKS